MTAQYFIYLFINNAADLGTTKDVLNGHQTRFLIRG